MKIAAIIPARYHSTRFPGKPLADINGKSMIRRVYEQVSKVSVDHLLVATEDQRIFDHVRDFGGEVAMTKATHFSGTERIAEVAKDLDVDIVVNIQGDEPFILPEQINALIRCFKQSLRALHQQISSHQTQIATLIKPITAKDDLFNPDIVKVVINHINEAMYFSRSPIPSIRDQEEADWINYHTFYRHIGVYGYRKNVLQDIVSLPPSRLEQAENLEQLRWLENGYRIKAAITQYSSVGIDTPQDLERISKDLLDD